MTQYEPRDQEPAHGAADQEFSSGTESRSETRRRSSARLSALVTE